MRAGKLENDAMHVRFLADYDYTPSADRRITIAYKAGQERSVRRECGEAAIALGRAEEIAPDPLDHDGAGRKGGSRARRAKA